MDIIMYFTNKTYMFQDVKEKNGKYLIMGPASWSSGQSL